MATYLACVDIGTSGAKGMVFDLDGNALASAYREYPGTYPRPGWVEQDPDLLVGATINAMARAVVQSGVKRLLSIQNTEQELAPAAKLTISLKILRIPLTSRPEYGRIPRSSLLFRTALLILLKIGCLSRFNFS
jgi:hypothetical protein